MPIINIHTKIQKTLLCAVSTETASVPCRFFNLLVRLHGNVRCVGVCVLFVLFSFFPISSAFSQQNVTVADGKVTDAKGGDAMAYVTCKALDARGSILAYVLTDGKGGFALRLPEGTEAVEFSMMGYDSKRVDIRNVNSPMHVRLSPSGIMLKGVTVKAKPIDVRKDTIDYNVSAFKGKEDRYIEDVLKKLPGIEVSADGAITYKGESINKVNIEGQDLLGNRYNQATRNMPAEAVATVQVMENDQPLRILKDKVPSQRATLNIKLKPGYKMRPFGEVKGGIGGFGNVIWDNGLTLINVGKKNQMLLTAKMNNSGNSLSGNTSEHIDYADLDNYVPLPSALVNETSLSRPPINEKRYLMNKSYSVGLNLLRRIGRYGSMRANISYYGTSDAAEDTTINRNGGHRTLSLHESNRARTRRHVLMPRLNYELNAPKVYLTDELTGSLEFEKSGVNRRYSQSTDEISSVTGGGDYSAVTSSASGMQAESNVRHPGYLQNKLRAVIGIGENTYSVNSFFRYFRRSEALGVDVTGDASDGGDPSAVPQESVLCQRMELERLMTRNSVSSTFNVLGNNLELKYAFELRSDNVSSDPGRSGRTSLMKHSFTPGYTIRYNKGIVDVKVPVSLFTSHIPWSLSKDKSTVYASPSVSWRHDFSPFWRMRLRGSLSRDEAAEVMVPDTYYKDYRTRVQTADSVGWTRRSGASLSLNYSNMITMFLWNFMASASWRTEDHYNEYSYGEELTTVHPVWSNVSSRSLFVLTSFDKTFAGTGGGVKGTLSYNRMTMPVAQNGFKSDITSNVASAALTLRWNKWAWLSVNGRPTFNLSWQDRYAGSRGRNMLRSFYNEVDVHLFPCKGLDAAVSWEYNRLEVERGRFRHNSFIDASVRFSATKRTELRVSMTNLLNRKVYEEASFSGLDYSYFSRPLRGREVMFSVAFNV